MLLPFLLKMMRLYVIKRDVLVMSVMLTIPLYREGALCC